MPPQSATATATATELDKPESLRVESERRLGQFKRRRRRVALCCFTGSEANMRRGRRGKRRRKEGELVKQQKTELKISIKE